jgi:hypothetical protein
LACRCANCLFAESIKRGASLASRDVKRKQDLPTKFLQAAVNVVGYLLGGTLRHGFALAALSIVVLLPAIRSVPLHSEARIDSPRVYDSGIDFTEQTIAQIVPTTPSPAALLRPPTFTQIVPTMPNPAVLPHIPAPPSDLRVLNDSAAPPRDASPTPPAAVTPAEKATVFTFPVYQMPPAAGPPAPVNVQKAELLRNSANGGPPAPP